VGEEDDVGRPLPDQKRVLDRIRSGAQDTYRLVTDLPPVAVGTMQQVPSPSLPRAREVRQEVTGAGREKDPPPRSIGRWPSER
jgi:hypothetical protein